MCQITILKFSYLGWKVQDSDLAHFLEDEKLYEIKPPLLLQYIANSLDKIGQTFVLLGWTLLWSKLL